MPSWRQSQGQREGKASRGLRARRLERGWACLPGLSAMSRSGGRAAVAGAGDRGGAGLEQVPWSRELPGPPPPAALTCPRSRASALFSCPYLCCASPSLWALHPPFLSCPPVSTCPLHLLCPLSVFSEPVSLSLGVSPWSCLSPGRLWSSDAHSALSLSSRICPCPSSCLPFCFLPCLVAPSPSRCPRPSPFLRLPLTPPSLLPLPTPLSSLSLSSPPVGHRWAPSS